MLIFILGFIAGSAGSMILITALFSAKMRESAYSRMSGAESR